MCKIFSWSYYSRVLWHSNTPYLQYRPPHPTPSLLFLTGGCFFFLFVRKLSEIPTAVAVMDPSHCEETRAGCHNVPNQYYQRMILIHSLKTRLFWETLSIKHNCLLQPSDVYFTFIPLFRLKTTDVTHTEHPHYFMTCIRISCVMLKCISKVSLSLLLVLESSNN